MRQSVHVALLLVFLLPAVTGWSSDICCPTPEDAAGKGCIAAGVCSDSVPAEEQSTGDGSDASHDSIFCPCVSCQNLFAHTSLPSLKDPGCVGRVVYDSHECPPPVFFTEIFRPPLV